MSSPGIRRDPLESTSTGDTDRVDAVQGRIAHAIALAGDPLAVGRPCSATECLQLPFRLRQGAHDGTGFGIHEVRGHPVVAAVDLDLGAGWSPRGPSDRPSKNSCSSSLPSGFTVYVMASPPRGHRARTRSGRRPRTHPSPSAVPIGCHQRRSRRRRRRRGRANRGSIRALQSTIVSTHCPSSRPPPPPGRVEESLARAGLGVESSGWDRWIERRCPQPSSAITDSGMSKFA